MTLQAKVADFKADFEASNSPNTASHLEGLWPRTDSQGFAQAFGRLTMNDAEAELARFTKGDCDPTNFPHREHVRMAFEMLHRHFESFASLNPDLLDKHVLMRWYRPERLASDCARHTFVLPEPVSWPRR